MINIKLAVNNSNIDQINNIKNILLAHISLFFYNI